MALPIAAIAAGGGWWVYHHNRDPLQNAQQMLAHGNVAGAVIELRNAVRDNPENAVAHFDLGSIDLKLGDPIAAERELRQASDRGYNKSAVTPLLAEGYLMQGRYKDLLQSFTTENLPRDEQPRILVLRSLAYLALHDLPAAQASAAEAELVAPKFAEAPLASARVAIAEGNPALADQKIDRVLEIDPHQADALTLRGRMLVQKGDKAGALAAYNAAIAAAPLNIDARVQRANLLILTGQHDNAAADVDFVLAHSAKDPRALYLKAVLRADAGDFAGADAALEPISTILPQMPGGYYLLAITKFNLKQPEQAADALSHYQAYFPNDLGAKTLRAQIELSLRHPGNAIEILNKVNADGHATALTHTLLGGAELMAGQPQQAAQNLQQAATLEPGNSAVLAELASAKMQMGDAAGAEGTLQRSLDASPTEEKTSEQLILAAIAAGDYTRANSVLNNLRHQVGDSENVGLLSGLLKLAQFDISGAKSEYEAVLKQDPSAFQAKLGLARIAGMQGQGAEQQKLLTEVLEKDQGNRQALSGVVPVLVREQKFAQAQTILEAAHAATPADLSIISMLAAVDVRAGDSAKAIDLVDQAQKNGAPAAPLITLRSQIQMSAGDTNAAMASFRELLTLDPGNVDARRALAGLLVRQKNFESATAVLRDGLKSAPNNVALQQDIVMTAYGESGEKAALAAADDIKKDASSLPAARLLKGNFYMLTKNPQQAAAAYDTEFQAAPSEQLANSTAGALMAAGQAAQARQMLQGWLAKNPDSADTAMLLATLDISEHQLSDATKKLNVVLAQRPNDVAALNNLAWVDQQLNDPAALGLAQRAFMLGPTPQVMDTLGWIMATRGNAAPAVPLLRQASAANPSDPSMRYHLAYALNATGEKQAAIEVLRQIVASNAKFDDQEDARHMLDTLTAKQ
jgi:cellulose synthase operon protein C